MKIFILSLILLIIPLVSTPNFVVAETTPMLAIVIDDFGSTRQGVEDMFSVNAPLTCAIMPENEYSLEDAEKAFENGHEIILHMPMEAHKTLPRSWYGPTMIKNYDPPEMAKNITKECLDKIPHAVGMNIHIGSGVSQNKSLMTSILEEIRDRDLYFLDSFTTQNSVCSDVAKELGVKFAKRDEFLEQTGVASYSYAVKMLKKATELAKTRGYAVVIGHVGMEGRGQTSKAIKDTLSYIEESGVEIVKLSKLIENYPQ